MLQRGVGLLLPILAGLAAVGCGWAPVLSPVAPSSGQPAVSETFTDLPDERLIDIHPQSVSDNLNELDSYRLQLSLTFTGTRSGQPAAGSIESLVEVTRQPAALHQYLQTTADIPQAGSVPGESQFFWTGDKTYVKKGSTGPWFSFSSGPVTPDQFGFFELERLITLPDTVAAPPRFANLAGRSIQQYRFDESNLSDPNVIFEDAAGELWLTTIGNYVVRYEISASLRIIIPDPQVHLFDEGQVSLRYTLSDINSNLTITPPVEALTVTNSLSDLPRLPDADIISVFPGFLEYTSAITPVGAALFYRDELTGQDWVEESLSAFNEKARLVYSREGQKVTILINPANVPDKIKVSLSLDVAP